MNKYLVTLLTFSCFLSTTNGWGYTDIDVWYVTNPVCGSTTQSPINIVPDQVQYYANASRLIFNNYDILVESVEYDITNNGHTVIITLTYNGQDTIGVSSGGLPGYFILYQFHFHWGSSNVIGSEHTIDGAHYIGECHFVHYNSAYNSSTVAMNQTDGLAVVAFFIQIGPEDNVPFNSVIEYLYNVTYDNQKVGNMSTFIVKSLFPSDTVDFYRYKGSLTTPPCFNSVTWTIFRQPITLSLKQIEAFRELHENLVSGTDEELLVNNFRTVQPLNGRIVYSTFDNTKIDWTYNDTTNWDMLYPSCGGVNQSPINIVTTQTSARNDWSALTFNGYSQPQNITFINTGYSIDMMINSPGVSISGGGLPGSYKLYKLTLHWGTLNTSGAEHTIDSFTNPLEIQLLHYNDLYDSSSNASEYPQGLAILSVFAQISQNATLSMLDTSTLESLQFSGSSMINNKFILQTLLPADTSNFYRYNGSLTVPRCLETVVWTVFTDTLYISPVQLMTLQTQVYSTASTASPPRTITSNSRPVQSLNNRTVYRVSSSSQTGGIAKQTTGNPTTSGQSACSMNVSARFNITASAMVILMVIQFLTC